MSYPVKIGMIGCGSVMCGPYMSLIERLRGRGQVEVVMACDVVEAKREMVRERFGILLSTVYPSYHTTPGGKYAPH
jgi:predicted dehydrogenase